MASQGSLPIPMPARTPGSNLRVGHTDAWAEERGWPMFLSLFVSNDYLFHFLIVLVIPEHMLILKNLHNTILEYSKDCRTC